MFPIHNFYGIHNFDVFFATSIVMALIPGPDTLFILGRSVAQGRGKGIASVIGISCGSVIHTFAAALGLSALLAASASAFLFVKLAGAAYLVYLGVKMLFSRSSASALPTGFSSADFAEIFKQGLLTNVLNPKVALFFLAFVPQFIDVASSNKFAAFITLGLCYVGIGLLWYLFLAWSSSLLGNQFRGNAKFMHFLNRSAGALFVFLGLRLASSK
ncbi:LysE family translocator [Methylobacter sp. G7]|uniref:LysE family translocator n=1 Tax=Methylobacter sp. G7 TaxID=3230117 RepID=UPI003D802BD9